MGQITGWIREAVIYQIYVRSFADSDGDGVGDLAGIRSRLDYLASLGVDAIWLTPFYDSPFVDGGYDVADYRSVAEVFGGLEDFDALVKDAHGLGLRVIIDVVPNHTSDRHSWFREALEGRNRERYIFRDKPNDWQSVFGGPAWTQVADGQWYLHLFAPEQPDLNWQNPLVRKEFEAVLRFWLDRGADGFRVDVAHGLVKPDGLPSFGRPGERGNRPYFDQDAVHEIYRSWRSVVGDAALVAEARLRDPARTARYVRPGEMDQAFNFQFLWAPWDFSGVRDAVETSLASMAQVGALPSWVIGNHDEVRAATRYALAASETDEFMGSAEQGENETGLRRARAMAMLSLALPGSAYVYQGDELGLPEVVDLPDEVREDPIWHRSGGLQPGRDGCRVPLPWSGPAPPFGFGPPDGKPAWLPQPESWQGFSVAAQLADPRSTLTMYKKAIKMRRHIGPGGGLTWLEAPPGVLAFARGNGLACAVNFGDAPVPLADLPFPGPVVLLSDATAPDNLPPGAAAWALPR